METTQAEIGESPTADSTQKPKGNLLDRILMCVLMLLAATMAAVFVVAMFTVHEIPEDEMRSAIGAATAHAEEFPESSDPITSGSLINRGFEPARGRVDIAGSPEEGWCVRAAVRDDGHWAYYDSEDGALTFKALDTPPSDGPCHGADFKRIG